MKPAGDVFERNLRLLLRRSYVPALPAPHFRDRLESLFLAEAARGRSARRARATAREDPARALPRWAVAAAAVLLATVLGWRLLAPAAAPTRADLLARGDVALSSAEGSWRAAGADERQRGVRFTPPRLAVVTPQAAEIEILLASGRVHVAPRSELEVVDEVPAGPTATLRGGAAWFLAEDRRVDLTPGVAQPLLALERGPEESLAAAPAARREASAPTIPPPVAAPPASPVRALAGRVVDSGSGEPLHDFEVGLLREHVTHETPPPLRRAFSGADGAFRWPDPPTGKQRVFVHAEGFALCALGEFDLSGESPQLVANLERGASVHGVVLDEQGNPVPDALVLSEHEVPSDGLLFEDAEHYFWLPVQARSGPDGRFELAHLTLGVHELRASAGGHAPAWLHGVSVPGAAGEELAFTLGAGGAIAGHVEREDGGPWAGAVVVAVAMDQDEHARTNFGYTLTDAGGDYRFEHLPPITMVVVLIRPDDRPDARPVQVAEHQTITADFGVARRGILLHGRVLDGAGLPLARRTLGLFDPVTSSWSQDWIASSTDADGAYSFEGVKPGPYLVFLIDELGRGLRCVDEIELAPGTPEVARDFRLPRGRLELTVRTAESGEPVKDSAVILLRLEGGHSSFSGFGTTDADGRCTLDQRPGSYVVNVYPARAGLGYASEVVQVDEDRPTQLELLHEPGGAVDMIVRDGEGHGLEGAAVTFVDEAGREHQFSRSPLTDSAGRYRAWGVRPGRYRVHATLAGHEGPPVEFRYELGHELEVPLVLAPLPR